MPKLPGLTKKKSDTKSDAKAPASSGSAGFAWHPSMDEKSEQRQKGNQSMLRGLHEKHGTTMIPRRKDIESMFGEAKEDSFFGMKKNSTNYRPVLDHLDALNNFLDSTELAPDAKGMDAQLDQAIALTQNLEKAVMDYINAKKNNKKAVYMQNILLPVIRNVRVSMIAKVNQYKVKPPIMMPKWYLIANTPLHKSIKLDDSMSTGASDKGGVNEVQFFRLNSSTQGVFKKDKSSVASLKELDRKILNGELDEHYSNTSEYTEADVAAKAGIDAQDAHLANRNVALYRLDRLLGGDVIPRTEFALRRFGTETVQGTIMYKAAGESAGKLLDSGKLVPDASRKTGDKQNAVNVKDPALQRLLSKLQLLDSLAMQVDRHGGNFFIEYDETGKVIGIKGIDNDMSFGERTKLTNIESYPGVSKFVDKEMAQRILALRPEDLQAALGDLLSDKEMAALQQRLAALQQHLQSAKLLEPDEWDDMTAQALMDENQSYFSTLANAVR